MHKIKEIPFIKCLLTIAKRCQDNNISATSAQLSYYLILSVFPFIIFLLNLLAYTNLGQQEVLSQLLNTMPQDTANLLEPIILGIVNSSNATLLSVSLFLSLWSGSNGVKNIILAMDKAFHVKEKRNPIVLRIISVLFTGALAFIIIFSLLTQVFGNQILALITTHLKESVIIEQLFKILSWIFPIVVMTLTFSLLFKYGPSFIRQEKPKFKHALIGGLTTTIGWGLVSTIFSLYVDNFGKYSVAYGSLGGVIVLLIWLFLSSMMIMLGAEVVATLYHDSKGSDLESSSQ